MSVSVITPCYNDARWLAATIESVKQQTYTQWEMIIVDDCSTDETQAIVAEHIQSDPRIQYIRLPQQRGAAHARNVALNHATGRFIAFLDADDIWLPAKLERQVSFMLDGSVAFCFSDYRKLDAESESLSRAIGVPAKTSYRDLLSSNHIPCLTAVYDTEQLGKVEMPLFEKRNDYALWLKILKRLDYAHSVDEVLAHYRVNDDTSLSANKFSAAAHHWNVLRRQEKLGLMRSLYHFARYTITGTVKYLK